MRTHFYNDRDPEHASKNKGRGGADTAPHLEDGAGPLFTKGYGRATFVDVAKRIGLSKGAVYWHFKSKVDLRGAILMRFDMAIAALSI